MRSLSASLKLSTAVAVVGVAIALVMLRGQPKAAAQPLRATPAPEPG